MFINGTNIDTNEEKAEVFATAFSDISSNKNYNNNFQSRKQNIELNQSDLYANNSDFTNAHHLKNLNAWIKKSSARSQKTVSTRCR